MTAHNEVVPFDIKDGEAGPKLVWSEAKFLSRPILYSTTVQWTGEDEVLVVAGTVFGEILVWKCWLGEGAKAPETLFVFTGHEGSIFGVAISPEVEVVPGRKQRLLASCSDDRTVRVWDITEGAETSARVEPETITTEARETGFGENQNSDVQTTEGSTTAPSDRCLAVATGHASRIWQVRFACAEDAAAGPIEVVSFGEDATMQRWRLADGDGATNAPSRKGVSSSNPYPYTLEHVDKTACHNGKHIWSCAVTSDGPGRTCTVTGGADGKITLLRGGQGTVSVTGSSNVLLSLGDVLGSLPDSDGDVPIEGSDVVSLKPARDGFLRYAYLSEDSLLVSTISGRLLVGDLTPSPSWVEVITVEAIQQDLKTYNVVKAVAPGTAIIGSASGHLYVYRAGQELKEIAQLPGKITDVLCIPDPNEGKGRMRIFVTILGSTQATIFTLNTLETDLNAEQSHLALHLGFVVTSVGVCGDLLLLGSRKGVITVYQKEDGGYVHRTFRNDCKTKGGDAVTSIITLPPLSGAEPKYVLTTCRDGKYRIYEILSLPNGFSLQLRHETTPPLGPMLEGARLVQSEKGDLELIIHGFRSTNFVVWNETLQQEIASVACGGAHRTFDYFSDPNDAERFRFVYTKASAMGIFSQDEPSVQVVRHGGHGREIRAVTSNGSYIATGAEDTCIRIWEREEDEDGTTTEMRCVAVLRKHTAGLQALEWTLDGYLASSAGAEEFFIWKVTTLESEYKGLAVVCEAVYPSLTEDGDLRIMDFTSIAIPRGADFPEDTILLTMVFSNSVIKTYLYTELRGFEPRQTGRYTGACLTQVKNFLSAPHGVFLVTGSTDGVVAIWTKPNIDDGEDENIYSIVSTTQVHQNSVKSLVVEPLLGDICYIYTVGDDNSLSVHTSAIDRSDGGVAFGAFACHRVRDAHAAAITAIKVLNILETHTDLATVSNDQRLKIWRVTKASEGQPMQVELLYSVYSALADPGGLTTVTDDSLIVAGAGMEIWRSLPKPAEEA